MTWTLTNVRGVTLKKGNTVLVPFYSDGVGGGKIPCPVCGLEMTFSESDLSINAFDEPSLVTEPFCANGHAMNIDGGRVVRIPFGT